MRIAFIANTPDSRETGIAKIMNSLADALCAQNHSVDLIFGEAIPFPGPRQLKDILFSAAILPRLRKLWRNDGPHDVVAIHSMSAAPYVWTRGFKKSLPPCVVVSYGSDEMRWNLEKEEAALGLRPLRLISKIFYGHISIRAARFATRCADHVMVAAKSEIAFYQSQYGMPASKISFVPNGVSPDYFSPHDYSRPVRDLLFLGGWEWRKGTRYLVRAFEKLSAKYPHLRLSLAGIGGAENEARAAFSAGLQSRISVYPSLAAAETPALYAKHDLFVFPSLFESMSLVVPEAMASGLPVVTTRACGMQDIIEDGKNGFLVPVRDADELCRKIELLIENPELREKLGREAQQSARKLLWSEVASAAAGLYQTVIRENNAL